ncbi:unnamed protein product [Owenia fusiformis]|uniref:Uncharacterized protein n=1 Tax=Owenia fusiformis TaxID=6347 RepID=A0A8S4P5N3_OWEFU|nr:unnamed protein product [Owenia fusiformis]
MDEPTTSRMSDDYKEEGIDRMNNHATVNEDVKHPDIIITEDDAENATNDQDAEGDLEDKQGKRSINTATLAEAVVWSLAAPTTIQWSNIPARFLSIGQILSGAVITILSLKAVLQYSTHDLVYFYNGLPSFLVAALMLITGGIGLIATKSYIQSLKYIKIWLGFTLLLTLACCVLIGLNANGIAYEKSKEDVTPGIYIYNYDCNHPGRIVDGVYCNIHQITNVDLTKSYAYKMIDKHYAEYVYPYKCTYPGKLSKDRIYCNFHYNRKLMDDNSWAFHVIQTYGNNNNYVVYGLMLGISTVTLLVSLAIVVLTSKVLCMCCKPSTPQVVYVPADKDYEFPNVIDGQQVIVEKENTS